MKCKICGAESGKYPLCPACNIKKEKGEIYKCTKCGNWHYANAECPAPSNENPDEQFLYDARKTLVSKSERSFFEALNASVPEGYHVFPQINLASFIERTDDARFHNELFRNVDFLITNEEFQPRIVVEINDQTHLNNDRKERDKKVQSICEEAGIPVLKLWTSYGVNQEYINGRVTEILAAYPVARIHHFDKNTDDRKSTEEFSESNRPIPSSRFGSKKGCYVATCVYGSYDCPQVWVLRRYRDKVLSNNVFGRWFIKVYYAISPTAVNKFGKSNWFVRICKRALDKIVNTLQSKGFEDTPYND
jgi:hypothetical protein